MGGSCMITTKTKIEYFFIKNSKKKNIYFFAFQANLSFFPHILAHCGNGNFYYLAMWWFIGVAGADTKLHLILGNSDTVLERILVAHSSQLQFSLQCSFGCFLNSRWIEKLFGLDGFLSEEAVDEANEVIDLQKKK